MRRAVKDTHDLNLKAPKKPSFFFHTLMPVLSVVLIAGLAAFWAVVIPIQNDANEKEAADNAEQFLAANKVVYDAAKRDYDNINAMREKSLDAAAFFLANPRTETLYDEFLSSLRGYVTYSALDISVETLHGVKISRFTIDEAFVDNGEFERFIDRVRRLPHNVSVAYETITIDASAGVTSLSLETVFTYDPAELAARILLAGDADGGGTAEKSLVTVFIENIAKAVNGGAEP